MNIKFLLVAVFLLSAFSLSPSPANSSEKVFCTPWKQVNEDAFGMDTGSDSDFSNEEGFESLVFKGQLYLGMEADNAYGARIWRTKANITIPQGQTDWEEVAADDQGNPFGVPDPVQNDHIDSLMAFNGYLYASTANRSENPSGIRIFKSFTGDPGSWQDALKDYGSGFGDTDNENFKDMQVFKGELCGGTWNITTGAQVWCTADGVKWSQRNRSGFGDQDDDPSNARIWSGGVFNGGLYFGVQNEGSDPNSSSDDIGKVYRSLDTQSKRWEEVYQGEVGSRVTDILGNIDNHLYISTQSDEGIRILRSPSGNLDSWEQVNIPGMGDPNNEGTVVDGASFHNGALYVAITNWNTGVEIWRTTGIKREGGMVIDWEKVSSGGLGDINTTRAQLITFNDHLYAWTSNFAIGQQVLSTTCPAARYVIVLIGDGMGPKHIEATANYTNRTPILENWTRYWMTTYPEGGSYNPNQAWSDFDYVSLGYTDSAAAATAMFTGHKTSNQRISVSSDGSSRLFNITDKARLLGKGSGAVTSVYISHATPGAWYAHNDNRYNGYAIADEGFWGDPNTTGDPIVDPRYAGGHGMSLPPIDVLIGAGHPSWNGGDYLNMAMLDLLSKDDNEKEGFDFIQRIAGSKDGGGRLNQSAGDKNINRIIGIFGGSEGNLEYRLADGSGSNPENPTLAEMARAALAILSRNPKGFNLLIEGGAIDWASHENNMDRMIGEMIDFNEAIHEVVDWIEDPTNNSSWKNTLVIITGDHETGYLTLAPGVFPDQPLGIVNAETINQEKMIQGTAQRASWVDVNANGIIDPGEKVNWAWNLVGHTNSLIPVFVKGSGAELFDYYLSQSDPVRGLYFDNTDVFRVLDAVTVHSSINLHKGFLPIIYH